MSSQLVRAVCLVPAALLLFGTQSAAYAQIRPGQAGPMGGRQGPQKPKKAGVAEKAPEKPGTLPTTPVLRPPSDENKKFQMFQLDGYFRFRGDWFKNFNLGFTDDPVVGGAPFRRPAGCLSTNTDIGCESAIKSSNIRLRLEPTIRLDSRKAVHFQIDVLDNLVLGSTPNGVFGDGTAAPTNIPAGAFSDGQVAPEAGRNSLTDSVVVKRAWAEIRSDLGLLKFGRMPSHWGLGILANSGSADPIHGTYDLDSDYGDTADRLMVFSGIPGTQYRFGIGTDWALTSPTSQQSDIYRNRYQGQPWDLENADNVNQWIFVIAKLDSPKDFKDKLELNGTALNYGAYFVYRNQDYAYERYTLGEAPVDSGFAKRKAKAYIPDIWVRYALDNLEFEMEAVGIIGTIGDLNDVSSGLTDLKVRQFGGVARVNWHALNKKLNLGFEVGYASGDQWDSSPEGQINVRDSRTLPEGNDTTVNAFHFDFNYRVDLILFRELMGAVTNTTYLKPHLKYHLTDEITGQAAAVVSFANVPVATPGNGNMYGVELDLDLGYQSDGFFAGLAYGILLPMSALDHPAWSPTSGQGGPGFGFGDGTQANDNTGSADTAQTLQARLILKF